MKFGSGFEDESEEQSEKWESIVGNAAQLTTLSIRTAGLYQDRLGTPDNLLGGWLKGNYGKTRSSRAAQLSRYAIQWLRVPIGFQFLPSSSRVLTRCELEIL